MLVMNTMLEILPPMMMGAMLTLTMILLKGDICPGQRGRIHKVLPAIAAGWIIASYLYLYLLPLGLILLYYTSQVKTGKNRQSGPVPLLIAVDVAAFMLLIWQLVHTNSLLTSFALFLLVALLGAGFAHVLLVIARSRLKAFHRLLPIIGIVSAMLIALCVLPYSYGLTETDLDGHIKNILVNFTLLIISIVIWTWHLLLTKEPNKFQLGFALLISSASSAGFIQLFAS
jgi:hypothetical protein